MIIHVHFSAQQIATKTYPEDFLVVGDLLREAET